jgi:hypothetical protein
MGSAVQWVQENGLQDDPKALQKYIIYLEKIKLKNDGDNKRNKSERSKDTTDIQR